MLVLAGYRAAGRRAALPAAAWPYAVAAGILGLVLLFGLGDGSAYFVVVGLVGVVSSAYLHPGAGHGQAPS